MEGADTTSIQTETTEISTTIEDIPETTSERGIFRFLSCRKWQDYLCYIKTHRKQYLSKFLIFAPFQLTVSGRCGRHGEIVSVMEQDMHIGK